MPIKPSMDSTRALPLVSDASYRGNPNEQQRDKTWLDLDRSIAAVWLPHPLHGSTSPGTVGPHYWNPERRAPDRTGCGMATILFVSPPAFHHVLGLGVFQLRQLAWMPHWRDFRGGQYDPGCLRGLRGQPGG